MYAWMQVNVSITIAPDKAAPDAEAFGARGWAAEGFSLGDGALPASMPAGWGPVSFAHMTFHVTYRPPTYAMQRAEGFDCTDPAAAFDQVLVANGCQRTKGPTSTA